MELSIPVRRMGYRLAYTGLRGYWFLARPHTRGVKCVLTDAGRVLLVRHTYGPRGWDLPGGALKRGEPPIEAAAREIREELGVSISDWNELGQVEIEVDHHLDRVHCFHAEVRDPELVVDRGELEATRWFPRDELPSDLGRYSRRIMERVP